MNTIIQAATTNQQPEHFTQTAAIEHFRDTSPASGFRLFPQVVLSKSAYQSCGHRPHEIHAIDDVEDPVRGVGFLRTESHQGHQFSEGGKEAARLARWIMDHNGLGRNEDLAPDDRHLAHLRVRAALRWSRGGGRPCSRPAPSWLCLPQTW